MKQPMRPHRFTFLQTTAFRWVLTSSSVFAAAFLLVFGFIYWQTAGQMRQQFDGLLQSTALTLAEQPIPQLTASIDDYVRHDRRRMALAGLFDANGHPIAGNLRAIPPNLAPMGEIGTARIRRSDPLGATETDKVHVVARRLGNGDLLVLARSMDVLQRLTRMVTRALLLGAVPAVVLALAGGVVVSLGTVRRIEAIHAAARRVMAGHLAERLPLAGSNDDFDRLAGIVNTMLDEIERLMDEVKMAGEAIAHDLRTPLVRLRTRLERMRDGEAEDAETLRTDIDGAIGQLDELINTIRALLRLGAIEQGQRESAFATLDLAEIAREVGELYAPLAEDRDVTLKLRVDDASLVAGDRELLFEAMVNLVDNAVKFVLPGGRVQLDVRRDDTVVTLTVTDDGPGIPPEEREAVLRRFFRSDRSRHTPGSGLGLSLVSSIARLHCGTLAIESGAGGKGCRVAIRFVRERDGVAGDGTRGLTRAAA
jgi:signal transduction histidine kinase